MFLYEKSPIKRNKKKQIHLWTFVTSNILYTCIYIVYMGVNKSVFKGHLDTKQSQPELVEWSFVRRCDTKIGQN